jgi:acyl-CoA thioester hydrolase
MTSLNFGETRLTMPVRPNDLDALGHVNNAVALEYLEAGRWDWLARQDLAHASGIITVVARCEIDYRAEIPTGLVEVRTRIESPTEDEWDEDALTYRVRVRQRIHLLPDERMAVDAAVTVAFLDAAERSLVPLQTFVTAATEARLAAELLVAPGMPVS